MKKILTSIMIMILAVACANISVSCADISYSWYCIRNKSHSQPVLDSTLSIIEKYNVFYVDKNHGDNTAEKKIYLTFDAGYENGNIERILDIMKEEKVTGTFFILENLIYKNPELVKRMVSDGHIVANHTATHKDMSKMKNEEEIRKELETLEKLCLEKIGYEMPKLFRYPEGRFSEKSLETIDKLGYKTIFWSFAYADWDNNKQMTETAAKEKILSNVHNGAILLLHPTSKTNALVLKDVIKELKGQGYEFGSLRELH